MSLFFDSDPHNKIDFNRGYLLGSMFPETNLPLLKEKLLKMKHNGKNLKKHKALVQGFLLGLQDRRKARLSELEQVKKNRSSQTRER